MPGARTGRGEKYLKVLLAMLTTLLLATCSQPATLLDRILADGELRVVTRNSPDAYYLGSHGPQGPAYELSSRFAESLGVPLRLYTVRTRDAAIDEVAAGRAHIAAAGLSTGVELPGGANFGPGYQRVREHLIYRRRTGRPNSIADAARGQIEVAAGSAHQRTLEDLRLRYPDLAWIERGDTDTEEILADVSAGKVQFTIASSTEFALNRSVHPELEIALDLSPERALAWVINTSGYDSTLLGPRKRLFRARASRRADRDTARSLLRQGRSLRLPVLAQFHGARGEPSARVRRLVPGSGTAVRPRLAPARGDGLPGVQVGSGRNLVHGARGLMQMTEQTAAMMRAGDRHDARSSIFGGAKYLANC
jgi:membrane-bound lytic murein transglycosylase F